MLGAQLRWPEQPGSILLVDGPDVVVAVGMAVVVLPVVVVSAVLTVVIASVVVVVVVVVVKHRLHCPFHDVSLVHAAQGSQFPLVAQNVSGTQSR